MLVAEEQVLEGFEVAAVQRVEVADDAKPEVDGAETSPPPGKEGPTGGSATDAVPTPIRRATPVETRWIQIVAPGEFFDGWKFLARLNPPMTAVADVMSFNGDRMIRGATEIIKDSDFVDEEGEPIPCTLEGIGKLVSPLLNAAIRAWDKALALPKK